MPNPVGMLQYIYNYALIDGRGKTMTTFRQITLSALTSATLVGTLWCLYSLASYR
jgi:hypothetical protein